MMNSNKHKFLMVMLACLGSLAVNAQTRQKVGNNSMAISPSAALEVESTTKGFLPPRMTKVDMNAIQNPAEGLMVYCTTCSVKSIFVYSGTDWLNLVNGLVDAGPSSNGSAVVSAYGITGSAGTMTAGTVVSGVTQTINATVSKAGTYVITTGAVNGVTFAGSGTFAVTGSQDIVLTATGTPTVVGSNSFALNTSPSISFSRNTVPAVTTVLSSTNQTWMDRNLGATQVATSGTDYLAYGSSFQWGRAADGHELMTWTGGTAGSSTNTPVSGTSSTSTVTTNSTKMLIGSQNWYTGGGPDNLWQGVSGTNNPCPSGFRLPTSAEWQAEVSKFSSADATGAFASPLKLPRAGSRSYSDGSLSNVGSDGDYWSGTVSGTNASYLTFNSSSVNMYTNNRAFGFSVRCL